MKNDLIPRWLRTPALLFILGLISVLFLILSHRSVGGNYDHVIFSCWIALLLVSLYSLTSHEKRRRISDLKLKAAFEQLDAVNRQLSAGEQQMCACNQQLTEANLRLRAGEGALKAAEERYRMMFESMNSGVAVYEAVDNGEDFIFREFNKAAEEMEKVKRADLIGRRVTHVFPGVRELGLFSVFQRVYRTGEAESLPSSYYQDESHGGWRSSYVYKLPTGEVVALSSDDTRYKRVENELVVLNQQLSDTNDELETANGKLVEANEQLLNSDKVLRENESLFRLVSEQITLGIVIMQDDRVIFANQGLSDLCGYTVEEMRAWKEREFAKVIHPDNLGWVMDFNRRRQEGEFDITSRKEVKIVTKTGRVRPMEVFSRTVVFQGKFANLVSLIDIETRKKAEQELGRLNLELEERIRQRTQQLEYANKELSAFSYSVSHDLRAPLRNINGYAEILEQKFAALLPGEGKEYLGRLRNAGGHMSLLIEDFLKLSQVTRTGMRLQEVNLSGLAGEIAGQLRQRDPSRTIDFSALEGVRVSGDPALLKIALENLLDNAWKYTSRHARARIGFGRETRDGKEVYYVKDDGAGFDMALAGKLFGPFQRLHTAEEFEGTGIGLAIVHAVVNRHGGRVWAESAVEQGATFFFTLGQG